MIYSQLEQYSRLEQTVDGYNLKKEKKERKSQAYVATDAKVCCEFLINSKNQPVQQVKEKKWLNDENRTAKCGKAISCQHH